MIIKEYRDYSKSNDGSKRYLLKCDECGVEFQKARIKSYRKYHFCNRVCYKQSQTNGFLINKIKETNVKNHGVAYATQILGAIEKKKKTCVERYGHEYPLQSKIILSNMKNTNLERYGVENVFQDKDVKIKCAQTLKKNYGVNHALQSKEIRKKFKETCIKRYGVEHHWKDAATKELIQQTCFKKYGVRFSSQHKETRIKAHETMKKNGTYGKSSAEDNFYEFLCENFENENVERQYLINRWSIDFKVGETFIQFDGVYWHGIGRTNNELLTSFAPRDRSIYCARLKDQKQDVWFKENNKNLIRVTDKEFEQQKRKVYDKLRGVINDQKKEGD